MMDDTEQRDDGLRPEQRRLVPAAIRVGVGVSASLHVVGKARVIGADALLRLTPRLFLGDLERPTPYTARQALRVRIQQTRQRVDHGIFANARRLLGVSLATVFGLRRTLVLTSAKLTALFHLFCPPPMIGNPCIYLLNHCTETPLPRRDYAVLFRRHSYFAV